MSTSVGTAQWGHRAHDEKPMACHLESIPERIPLRSALPSKFRPFYAPDLYETPENINEFGRPKFTERDLVDWGLNDVRSLLFWHKPRKAWGGRVPEIKESGFRIELLPLNASDSKIISVLSNSSIYREHNIEKEIREQLAAGAVRGTREISGKRQKLTLPQWRYMIESYLLNMGCEAQTRLDYTNAILKLKKRKLLGDSPLSKLSSRLRCDMRQLRGAPLEKQLQDVDVSEVEMRETFEQVQLAIYKRLGLDWEADTVVF